MEVSEVLRVHLNSLKNRGRRLIILYKCESWSLEINSKKKLW